MNGNYLTESSLEDILTEVFSTSAIEKQFRILNSRKRPDYLITLSDVDKIKMDTLIDRNTKFLAIEYDGHYHYMDNWKSYQEMLKINPCKWSKFDLIDKCFILRIPYFVQLDSTMSNFWFNTKKDYNHDFPHGFISKHCKLPVIFTRNGEDRFIKELENLPQAVSKQIALSLINKIGKKESQRVVSDFLFGIIKSYL